MIQCVGGPLDGGWLTQPCEDKCIQAYPHENTVAIYWRDGDVAKFIKTLTREEYEAKLVAPHNP